MTHALQIALVLVFPALVILGAATDVAAFTIPNWISLGLAAVFLPAALAMGMPLPAMGLHLAVGAVALVAGIAMFAAGWIGGGDAKLFAAAALWLGLPAAPTYLAATGIAGGVLVAVLLVLRSGALRTRALAGPAWVARLAEPAGGVPYGVAIAAGALAALPRSAVGVLF